MVNKIIQYTVVFFLCINTATAENNIDLPLKTPASLNSPFPSLVKFAAKHNIVLNSIEIGENESQPEKGNSVSFLITLKNNSSVQQWLAIITQDDLTPDEIHLAPLPDETIYTSTGRVFKFTNTRAALNFNLIGPFTATESKSDEKYIKQLSNPYRVLLSQEKLNCDMDLYAQTAMVLTKRCEEAGVNLKDLFYRGRTKPIPENDLEKGKPYARIVHPTNDEERIIFSVYFALNSFYSAAMAIDEFKDITYQVIDLPIWSIITKFRLSNNINYSSDDVHTFNASSLGIVGNAYEQPLKLLLNGKMALKASIVMTKPHPPLKACAGIVVLYAEHPVDKDKSLLIQLISAYKS
jgi:hypothetical protein